MQILRDDRLIEAEITLQICLVGRIDISRRVEQDIDDVTRNDAQQHKDDDRDPEQGHQHKHKATDDITKHPGFSGLPEVKS